MLSALYRFHGHGSLRYVFTNGSAVRSRLLTIKYTTNKQRTKPRVAVVVSKKVIKSAVGRNRIRRRIYEYIRSVLPEINPHSDIVLIVTSAEIRTIPYSELSSEIHDLLKQTTLLSI